MQSCTAVLLVNTGIGINFFFRSLAVLQLILFKFISLDNKEINIQSIFTACGHFLNVSTLFFKQSNTGIRHVFRHTYPVIEI